MRRVKRSLRLSCVGQTERTLGGRDSLCCAYAAFKGPSSQLCRQRRSSLSVLLQCRMREPCKHSQPQLKPQAISHQTSPRARGSSMVKGLHHRLQPGQLVLQTSAMLAPDQLKHTRTCSLDVNRRDVPSRAHSSSLQTALRPPPPHRAGLPICLGDCWPTRRDRDGAHSPTLTAAMTGEAMTDKVTPPVMAKFRLCLEVFFPSYLLWI